MRLPTIALVGRPNVGKSTIFNHIVGERVSIVEDYSGVTRDRIYGSGEWLDRQFRIIDTGGIDFTDTPLVDQIRNQVQIAIDEADLIVYVTDSEEGVTNMDERIANDLRQVDKPIVLAVNKVDNLERRSSIYEFYSLGLGDPFPLSGVHGQGFGDLLEEVFTKLPSEMFDEKDDDTIKFSFIGRPNVGKSSLVNAILDEERVIVSNIEGTTREAVDTRFVDEDGHEFTVIDTAGIRRKGKVYENVEKYSVLRAMTAIDRSDVTCLVIDAETGIREQDKRIAGYAYEAGRGIIFIVNKWDAVDKSDKLFEKMTQQIRQEFQYLSFAPILFTSAKTGQRVKQIPGLVKEIYENSNRRIQSSILNEVLMDAIATNQPPTDKGRPLKIFYMTQVAVGPPTFVVFVNDPEIMHFSYERFLENRLRDAFYFEGTPIKIITRART